MEKGVNVLCDTNILIELYKGNAKIVAMLRAVGEENIVVSDIVCSEIFFGAKDRHDLLFLERQLATVPSLPVNVQISESAKALVKNHVLSHRLSLADALIAATAIHHELQLFTLNLKDFRFIKNLNLYPF